MKETITLSESDGVRYLHFGTPWVQGAMRIARPDALELDYVRDMMSWLLFMHAPRRILQLGLGAGALTKWCWRHLPETHTTVVECEAAVVDVCRRFFNLPAEDDRLEVCLADAAQALQASSWRGRFGVIQIDLYDGEARGPVLDSMAFYRSVWEALAEPGIVAVNLFGHGDRSGALSLQRLGRLARGNVLELAPTAAGNRVVLAFKHPAANAQASLASARAAHRSLPAEQLRRRADWLERHYRFDANAWLREALNPLKSVRALGLGS
jgi:spermidine synthase